MFVSYQFFKFSIVRLVYMDISVGRRPLLESAFDAFGIDVAGYGFPAHSG